jgi:hypothetical protein
MFVIQLLHLGRTVPQCLKFVPNAVGFVTSIHATPACLQLNPIKSYKVPGWVSSRQSAGSIVHAVQIAGFGAR